MFSHYFIFSTIILKAVVRQKEWKKEFKVPKILITASMPRMPVEREDMDAETRVIPTTGCSPASLSPILGHSCCLSPLSASLLIHPSSPVKAARPTAPILPATWAILEPGFSGGELQGEVHRGS